MDYVTLGSTGITANKNGFGALPIQRVSEGEASYLLRKAFDNGITFYDTARFYTDSEHKIGASLSDVRDKIIIATKTGAHEAKTFWEHLETSLGLLKTDYVDIYQFHNPPFCPKPGDGSGLYEAILKAKEQGKVKHIGITNHRIHIAREAAESGLYETMQFPFSYIASREEKEFIDICRERNMGILAMKALAGGMLRSAKAAYAFMMQYDKVIPIWGMQKESELDEFLSYQTTPPEFDDEIRSIIERDNEELGGSFCRSCGYCAPCPAGIEVLHAARMYQMVRRAPKSFWGSDFQRGNMERVPLCENCGKCKERCPYGLEVPAILQRNWKDYQEFI